MNLIKLEPGDGTRYFVGYDYSVNRDGVTGDRDFFFAFGVGSDSLVGRLFDVEYSPSFDYFAEKMGAIDRGRKWTMWVGYLCLLSLQGNLSVDGHELENKFIPEWATDWNQRLDEGWNNKLLANNFIAWRMGYGVWADEATKERITSGIK